MNATLIKIDRNGSKHFEGEIKCDRCGGDGMYKWGAIINGCPQYMGTCFKCEGKGTVISKWIERTPEYQATLDAKREARWKERQAKAEAQMKARKEAEAKAEAKIKAERAISQHVGDIGQKLEIEVTYIYRTSFEVRSFKGFGTDTMYIHIFKDADGNVFTWKTANVIDAEYGDVVTVKGTIKDHDEYRDEKQTVLTRCKVKRARV